MSSGAEWRPAIERKRIIRAVAAEGPVIRIISAETRVVRVVRVDLGRATVPRDGDQSGWLDRDVSPARIVALPALSVTFAMKLISPLLPGA